MSSIYKHIVFAVQLFILTGVCSVPSPSYAQDITSNLIGHWTFEDTDGDTTTDDETGNGFNGTLTNMDPSADFVQGVFGQGISFDGLNDGVAVPDLGVNSNTMTFSGWIRGNSFSNTPGFIFDRDPPGSFAEGLWADPGGNLRYTWSNDFPGSTLTMNTGEWTFIAMTVSPAQLIVYKGTRDGGLQSQTYNTGYAAQTLNDLWIGQDPTSSRFFDGLMDDVRIYERTLTPADIQALFEAPLRNCEPQNQGTVIYNSNGNVMQYCDGSQWFAMGPTESVTGAGCTNPVSSAGDITYNTSTHQMQYCNSLEHVAMGPPGNGGAGCTNPAGSAGDLTFNTTLNMMQYCEGDEWIGIAGAGDCRNIGELCSNGSVYVGLSPDGNTRMYTQPADNGLLPWGTNSTVTFVTTGITDTTTGEANTVALIALDSDAGTAGIQQHEAAQFCADFTGHSNSDWYLPAEDELDVLYNNRNAGVLAGTFTETASPAAYYWASTEQAQDRARHTLFASGGTNQGVKDQNRNFRCVRKD